MSFGQAEEIVEQCPPEALSNAISTVFRRLLANILLDPENKKFHVVRKENTVIRTALQQLPDSVIETLFAVLGFVSDVNAKCEKVYVFNGDKEKLTDADRFFSYLEECLEKQKNKSKLFHLPLLETHEDCENNERRKQILHEFQQDIQRRKEETGRKSSLSEAFHSDDFLSVQSLVEKARRTLLNTGRIRNIFFEERDFSLRRMLHGRVYACKEGCGVEFLEAHWHLFSGKNILYSYVAHLAPDASAVIHLGVEHGYQYNLLPGTKNFRKTVNFSSKKVNKESGALEYVEHPDRPCEACVYCGVSFSQLFL